MMNMTQYFLAAAMASLLLAGCSTTGVIYEGRYAHKDGWHPGTVVAIGKGQDFTDRLVKGCPDAKEVGSYVKIRYTGDPHLRWGVVPQMADSQFRVDDRVYININTCTLVYASTKE
jgi:hypothetical protein